ncbi:MAG: glycosyltransferase family 2 protein [Candidatus Altiarchaeota archaeon]|nr:glycosyltransferase family 2 protein [Candidatus Altiarchaeota archaeon]
MAFISFIIPAFNEEGGIGEVIDSIPYKALNEKGFKTDVLVIDDGSTDRTHLIAESRNAKVIKHRTNKGKGGAINTAFKNIHPDARYVVMLDADNTYNAGESTRLLELLTSGFCDVVIGSRLEGKMNANSMSYFNRIGNWIFTFLVRIFYTGNITDCCSGFVAWKREVIDDLLRYSRVNGFSIEMEMITKARRLGYDIYSIPITYDNRYGSKSSLHPVRDGVRILWIFLRNLNWKPPKTDETPWEQLKILGEY